MGYAIYWSKNNTENSLINQISATAATESFNEISFVAKLNKTTQENAIEWNWLSEILENMTDKHIDLDTDDLCHSIA